MKNLPNHLTMFASKFYAMFPKLLLMPTLSISGLILLAQQGLALPLPHINEGESYAELREELLRIGYQPVEGPEEKSILGNDVYERTGWEELEDCAPTGLGLCTFVFTDNHGNKLDITTSANEDGGPPNQRHQIHDWEYEQTQ